MSETNDFKYYVGTKRKIVIFPLRTSKITTITYP